MIDDLNFILVAGGSSSRFGGQNKLFQELDGLPVWLHAVRTFLPALSIDSLIIVTPPEARNEFAGLLFRYFPAASVIWADAGNHRGASVMAGLNAIKNQKTFVAIHDAARPLASVNLLQNLLAAARRHGGAIPGKKVSDTIKKTGPDGVVTAHIDRSHLWQVETPQVFDLQNLLIAYRQMGHLELTDDAAIFNAGGFECAVVPNLDDNTKITYWADYARLREKFEH